MADFNSPGTRTGTGAPGSFREAQQHSEGKVARTLEQETAKLPSDVWLWAAAGAVGASLAAHACGRRATGLLFGQWVAPFLLFGVYNKIVKTQGSDRLQSGKI